MVRAPGKSPKACLVSIADKLYNLRDQNRLNKVAPEGWSDQHVQEYFEWAGQVVGGMLGSNPALEQALQEVLQTHGVSLHDAPVGI